MSVRASVVSAAFAVAAIAGVVFPGGLAIVTAQQPAPQGRVFEIRTYTASAGKLDALKARFRDHTIGFFEKHNMTSIAYWEPTERPGAGTTLIYILAHDSVEAARKNWAAFNADPEWVKVREASNVDGNIVAKVESYFANPVDFSPIR